MKTFPDTPEGRALERRLRGVWEAIVGLGLTIEQAEAEELVGARDAGFLEAFLPESEQRDRAAARAAARSAEDAARSAAAAAARATEEAARRAALEPYQPAIEEAVAGLRAGSAAWSWNGHGYDLVESPSGHWHPLNARLSGLALAQVWRRKPVERSQHSRHASDRSAWFGGAAC